MCDQRKGSLARSPPRNMYTLSALLSMLTALQGHGFARMLTYCPRNLSRARRDSLSFTAHKVVELTSWFKILLCVQKTCGPSSISYFEISNALSMTSSSVLSRWGEGAEPSANQLETGRVRYPGRLRVIRRELKCAGTCL